MVLHHGVDAHGPYFSSGPHGRRHHYRTAMGMERARMKAMHGGFLAAGRHRRVGRPRVHHRRRMY